MPDFELENSFSLSAIAGVDEVGYGAWAGPVVVAAVSLDRNHISPDFLRTVNDSKALSASQREAVYTTFTAHPHWGKWVQHFVELGEIHVCSKVQFLESRKRKISTPRALQYQK